jgi:uncharacterized membrane protein YbhN (UPF0104 family)
MNAPSAPRRGVDARVVAGWAVASICLLVVLRRLDLRTLVAQIRDASPAWAALAVLADVASYATQGTRWSVLLRGLGDLSPLRATQAVYAGLFVNETMPLRAGELVRAFVAARRLERSIAAVLPSMVVERLLDGAGLAAGIAAIAALVPLPRSVVEAEEALAILVGAAAIGLGVVARRHGRRSAEPPGRPAGLRAGVTDALAGLARIGGTRVAVAAVLSALFLGLQGLSLWAALRAFGIAVSPLAGLGVALVVRLGTAVPAAPSNLGTYQFATVLALRLFGVDAARAAGFSIAGFALLTAPLWALGMAALAGTGLTLSRVRAGLPGESGAPEG